MHYYSVSFFLGVTVLTVCFFFFFFNDTATTEIYTLSLHDALPILSAAVRASMQELYTFSTHIWVLPAF